MAGVLAGLRGAELLAYRDRRHDSVELGQVRALLEKAHAVAVIPDDATVHFEGSLAEGFGNEGSDIDLLLIVPGSEQAVMPTVLFLDGRRVELLPVARTDPAPGCCGSGKRLTPAPTPGSRRICSTGSSVSCTECRCASGRVTRI